MSIRFVHSWHKMTQKVITKIKKRDPENDDLLGGEQHSSTPKEGNRRHPFLGEVRKWNRKCKIPHRKDDHKAHVRKSTGTSAHDSSSSSSESEKEFRSIGSIVSHVGDHGSESSNSDSDHIENGSYTDDMGGDVQFFDTAGHESSKSISSSILSTMFGLKGRMKSFFIAIVNRIHWICDSLHLKLGQIHQIVWKCFFSLGKILLVATMMWLDCVFRGINSFVRLGTTSFFSVVWFSIFSVIAMVGILKFVLVLGIAVLIGVMVSVMISILIIAVSGATFLWLYGSFWTTFIVIFSAGLAFMLNCQRFALMLTTVYSVYCAETYVGWLGVVWGLHLSFITTDAFGYYLKNNLEECKTEQADGIHVEPHFFSSEAYYSNLDSDSGKKPGQSSGVISPNATDSEMTPMDEIVRLFDSTDHYSAFGLPQYQQVDLSLLKREYRKKARLVHPDKNMGNEKAAQAFMKLQSAYEVLLDPVKRKAYDDEHRKKEMQSYFAQFRRAPQKNSSVPEGSSRENNREGPVGEPRKIACKKCGGSHMWFPTKKYHLKARWCQDCNDFHEAIEGDGWVEQSSQALLFGMLQKVDVPVAYAYADGKVFDATEWFVCQGIRCPPNTHKPSFHVNTSTKTTERKRTIPKHRSKESAFSLGGSMTDDEFFDWLHNAMQSGMPESFSSFGGASSTDSAQTSTTPKRGSKDEPNTNDVDGSTASNKRKRKGKRF